MRLHKDGHAVTTVKSTDYRLLFCGCSGGVAAGALGTWDAHGDSVGLGRIHYLHSQRVTSAPLIPFKSSTLLVMY